MAEDELSFLTELRAATRSAIGEMERRNAESMRQADRIATSALQSAANGRASAAALIELQKAFERFEKNQGAATQGLYDLDQKVDTALNALGLAVKDAAEANRLALVKTTETQETLAEVAEQIDDTEARIKLMSKEQLAAADKSGKISAATKLLDRLDKMKGTTLLFILGAMSLAIAGLGIWLLVEKAKH